MANIFISRLSANLIHAASVNLTPGFIRISKSLICADKLWCYRYLYRTSSSYCD